MRARSPLLRDRGLPLKLKTVATSINKHEITAMRQFAEEELGVEFKMDGQINPIRTSPFC